MRVDVLVDAEAFGSSLSDDVRGARDRVYIQTLSFEGDRVGRWLADELARSKADDRRLIADDFYTLHRINDRYLYNPKHWFDAEIRSERRSTRSTIDEMERSGVRVKLVNPSGPLTLRALERNHKKIITIDDSVAYLGGINFTEHNFVWHDMMLRVEDQNFTSFLRDDFLATWAGQNLNTSRRFGDIEIYRLDGRNNLDAFKPILDLISSARRSIYVISPYITYPFYRSLGVARRNGAAVTLITPEENNWKTLKEYGIWEARRSGIDVRFYPSRMVHLKAMLIDDACLIMGSSNFDFLSCYFMQEIVALIRDKPTIDQFRRRVLEPDLAASGPCDVRVGFLKGHYHYRRIQLMTLLFKMFGRLVSVGR